MRRMIVFPMLLAMFVPVRAQVHELGRPEISVSANASVSAEPDIAEFRVSIIERQQQATTAFRMYTQTYNALQKSLRGVGGSAELKTDNLSVAPYFNYRKPEQTTPEYYQVTASMSLSVPLTLLNKVLGSIASVDGVTINGIQFKAKNQQELETKALELAVKEARSKAEAIAKLEGLSDLTVETMNTSTSRPPILYMSRTMAAQSEAPSVNASSISVSANINVTYTAKPH